MSRADVERAVNRQVFAVVSTGDKKDWKVRSSCVEDASSDRAYTCRVTLAYPVGKVLGGGSFSLRPQTVHATVSKDGKSVVVSDIRELGS